MKKYLKYSKSEILSDTKKGGLLSQFLTDYQKEFFEGTTPGCSKCLEKYYNNFITKYTKMETKKVEKHHGFILKGKYNGIKSRKFGPCRNIDLTLEQALDLMNNHAHGKELFVAMPYEYQDDSNGTDPLTLELEIKALKENGKKLTLENEELKVRNKELWQERDAIEGNCKQITSESISLRKENQSLKGNIHNLEENYTSLNLANDSNIKENQSLREEVQTLTALNKELEEKIDSLKDTGKRKYTKKQA